MWSVDAPLISQVKNNHDTQSLMAKNYLPLMMSFLLMQRLGSISSNNAIFSYTIPKNSSQLLADDNVKIVNGTIYFNVNFFLLNNEVCIHVDDIENAYLLLHSVLL